MEMNESSAGLAPTVSRDKWRVHVINKMGRGYFLIVGTDRRTANFFLAGKGYESCSYHAAQQLIKEGAVVPAGDHYLGTIYTLTEHARTQATAPRPKPVPSPSADASEEGDVDLTVLLQESDDLDQSVDTLSAEL